MRHILCAVALMAVVAGAALGDITSTGITGNAYPLGAEGIKAASLPPPGLYLRGYTQYYNADKLRLNDGEDADLGFTVNVVALVPRVIWMTDLKILGADYGMDALIPLVYTHIEADAAQMNDELVRVGDACIEPLLLSWHGEQWDLATGFAFFAPTGTYDPRHPATPGKNYWTVMPSLGGTVYFDKDKTWSLSLLGRYEYHTNNMARHIHMGDDFHIEGGVGKQIGPVEVGIAGYAQWQMTKDSGSDATWNKSDLDRVYALGPEVVYGVKDAKLAISLRSLLEFGARDRTEGINTMLTITKGF